MQKKWYIVNIQSILLKVNKHTSIKNHFLVFVNCNYIYGQNVICQITHYCIIMEF
jgi:hypothetical protein